MIVIKGRNVNNVYAKAIRMLRAEEQCTPYPSRNGPMLEFNYPVTSVYENPCERVLFDETRDANPFLHFFECLWMLAGRNDLAFMTTFSNNFAKFSDDGETLHGAYGHRWRYHFTRQAETGTGAATSGRWEPIDQLVLAVSELSRDPMSRRVVTQMWDPVVDLGRDGKDLPCNTSIMWRLRDGVLDMTVTNRSNDAVWGCYGANAVHFSFLQEYVASCLGVAVGRYYQVSNSLHVYPEFDVTKRIWEGPLPKGKRDHFESTPLFAGDATQLEFDSDLHLFMNDMNCTNYGTVFFGEVVVPMWRTFNAYKNHSLYRAASEAHYIGALDWRAAVVLWLRRRSK